MRNLKPKLKWFFKLKLKLFFFSIGSGPCWSSVFSQPPILLSQNSVMLALASEVSSLRDRSTNSGSVMTLPRLTVDCGLVGCCCCACW